MRVFVDTNVLVYLHDAAEPEKQRRARARLSDEVAAGSTLVISTQVLLELYAALTRGPHPIRTPEDAEAAVREACRLEVVTVDPTLVVCGITRARSSQLSLWDGLIVETGRAAGCGTLLTEDLTPGRDFEGLVVATPF